MGRIVKHPEERKNELMDTAEQLFIKYGFEKTLVSDIVRQLGVAQGTFYYYFNSKDDILGAILEKKWELYALKIRNYFDGVQMNALQKLETVFGMLLKPAASDDETFKLFEDAGIIKKFHSQFDEARVKKLKPVVSEIVRQGIEEKLFQDMQYTDEITEIIFYGVNTYMHVYSPFFSDAAVFREKISALEELLEIVLGIQKGSLHLLNK